LPLAVGLSGQPATSDFQLRTSDFNRTFPFSLTP